MPTYIRDVEVVANLFAEQFRVTQFVLGQGWWPHHTRRDPPIDQKRVVRVPFRRSEAVGIQVCRAGYRLCLDAGDRCRGRARTGVLQTGCFPGKARCDWQPGRRTGDVTPCMRLSPPSNAAPIGAGAELPGRKVSLVVPGAWMKCSGACAYPARRGRWLQASLGPAAWIEQGTVIEARLRICGASPAAWARQPRHG
jgi:hypothetical protein